jgi:hypothetical protein
MVGFHTPSFEYPVKAVVITMRDVLPVVEGIAGRTTKSTDCHGPMVYNKCSQLDQGV